MTKDKDLRHLKRVELLEILVTLSEENESLKEEIASLQTQLDSKKLLLSRAGSIAEAAISVNGVFEAAQAAAEQYLVNIKYISGNAQAAADRILADTRRQCENMKRQTQAEIDAKWNELHTRLEQYCSLHHELQDALPSIHQYADGLRNAKK